MHLQWICNLNNRWIIDTKMKLFIENFFRNKIAQPFHSSTRLSSINRVMRMRKYVETTAYTRSMVRCKVRREVNYTTIDVTEMSEKRERTAVTKVLYSLGDFTCTRRLRDAHCYCHNDLSISNKYLHSILTRIV